MIYAIFVFFRVLFLKNVPAQICAGLGPDPGLAPWAHIPILGLGWAHKWAWPSPFGYFGKAAYVKLLSWSGWRHPGRSFG